MVVSYPHTTAMPRSEMTAKPDVPETINLSLLWSARTELRSRIIESPPNSSPSKSGVNSLHPSFVRPHGIAERLAYAHIPILADDECNVAP
jgi:hypothetical protein